MPASVSVCLLYRPCIILSGKTDKTDRETRQTDIHRQDRQDRQDRWTYGWIRQTDRRQLRGLVGHGPFKDIFLDTSYTVFSSVYEDIGKRSNFKAKHFYFFFTKR